MKIEFLTPVSPTTHRKLISILIKQPTLEHVTRWIYQQSPPLDIYDIITQDEFTHDVVIPMGKNLVLVYDCT